MADRIQLPVDEYYKQQINRTNTGSELSWLEWLNAIAHAIGPAGPLRGGMGVVRFPLRLRNAEEQLNKGAFKTENPAQSPILGGGHLGISAQRELKPYPTKMLNQAMDSPDSFLPGRGNMRVATDDEAAKLIDLLTGIRGGPEAYWRLR